MSLNKLKVGIFGGTFNPPHIAHVKAAEAFASSLGLDKLLIMPDFLPPHKEYVGHVSAQERLHMCQLAFSHIDRAEISTLEIDRGGKSYTADTLASLASDDYELYFLCGTDMFLTMDTWYKPSVIFSLATICLIRRESDDDIGRRILAKKEEYEARFCARIIIIDAPTVELSSTQARAALLGAGAKDVLPCEVYEFITERGLYK